MSMLEDWQHMPVRVVDLSTESPRLHAAIEIRLHGLRNGEHIVVARWQPPTVYAMRRFVEAFKDEDSWLQLRDLDDFLALEGLRDWTPNVQLAFTHQLTQSKGQALPARSAAEPVHVNGVWASVMVTSLTILIASPFLAWLFSN